MKKIILLSVMSLSLFAEYVSITIPTTTQKPLMTYSNYSILKPMKLDHYNNNVNFPIIPEKMSLSTYDNFTNSKIMNTKTFSANNYHKSH